MFPHDLFIPCPIAVEDPLLRQWGSSRLCPTLRRRLPFMDSKLYPLGWFFTKSSLFKLSIILSIVNYHYYYWGPASGVTSPNFACNAMVCWTSNLWVLIHFEHLKHNNGMFSQNTYFYLRMFAKDITNANYNNMWKNICNFFFPYYSALRNCISFVKS